MQTVVRPVGAVMLRRSAVQICTRAILVNVAGESWSNRSWLFGFMVNLLSDLPQLVHHVVCLEDELLSKSPALMIPWEDSH